MSDGYNMHLPGMRGIKERKRRERVAAYQEAMRGKAQKIRELQSQGRDVLANAKARLERSRSLGDMDGVRYNQRRIAEYEALLALPKGYDGPVPRPITSGW